MKQLNTETGFLVENIYFSYSFKATGSQVFPCAVCLADEDILAEFREENQMEVKDGDDGNEDEQQEETPKRLTKSEVRQAIETLSRQFVCC